MEEDINYSVFVKAWYSDNTYAIFKSDGVFIVTEKPTVTNILGSSVNFYLKDENSCQSIHHLKFLGISFSKVKSTSLFT